jgi:hypothetical protein
MGMMVMPVALVGFLAPLAAVLFSGARQMRGPAMPPPAIIFFCAVPVILLIAYSYLRRKLNELIALPEQRSSR